MFFLLKKGNSYYLNIILLIKEPEPGAGAGVEIWLEPEPENQRDRLRQRWFSGMNPNPDPERQPNPELGQYFLSARLKPDSQQQSSNWSVWPGAGLGRNQLLEVPDGVVFVALDADLLAKPVVDSDL